MKRFIFFTTLLLFSIIAFAQVNGTFNYGQDGHVYFYLVNNTRFHVPVTVIARNAQKNQSRRDQVTVWSGNTFFFGPNYNWAWEKGETMTVIDGNGQSANWVCPYTDPDVINMNGGYSSNNYGYNQPQTTPRRTPNNNSGTNSAGNSNNGNLSNEWQTYWSFYRTRTPGLSSDFGGIDLYYLNSNKTSGYKISYMYSNGRYYNNVIAASDGGKHGNYKPSTTNIGELIYESKVNYGKIVATPNLKSVKCNGVTYYQVTSDQFFKVAKNGWSTYTPTTPSTSGNSYYKGQSLGHDRYYDSKGTSSDDKPVQRKSSTTKGCSQCKRGVNPYPQSVQPSTSWIGHYNSSGVKCPYCDNYNTSSHWHEKCSSCNVPRY